MAFGAIFFAFLTTLLVAYAVIPLLYEKTAVISQQRNRQMTSRLDRVMPRRKIKTLMRLYTFAPFVMAGILYYFFPDDMKVIGVVLGVVGGLIFPGFYIKAVIANNRKKFENQLVDALMIMSSSFRGGLSLIQAMEAVIEEMPEPINQEFLTVLGENKMGVSLEEALNHLFYRMPSSALQQTITAILLARETGGNLPLIFQRIVHVIREHKRIKSQLETLTVQGKLQGIIMSLLPVAFAVMILSTNPSFFDYMLSSSTGRALLTYAVISETIGAALIWKISTFKEF